MAQLNPFTTVWEQFKQEGKQGLISYNWDKFNGVNTQGYVVFISTQILHVNLYSGTLDIALYQLEPALCLVLHDK